MNSLEEFLKARIGNSAPKLTLEEWARNLAEEYILYVRNCLDQKSPLVASDTERVLRGDVTE